MRLLFPSLELEEAAVLLRKEAKPDAPALYLDGLGELLPKLGHRRRDASRRAPDTDRGAGTKAGLLSILGSQPVTAKGAGHSAEAIDMVAALPVFPSAGVLVYS